MNLGVRATPLAHWFLDIVFGFPIPFMNSILILLIFEGLPAEVNLKNLARA